MVYSLNKITQSNNFLKLSENDKEIERLEGNESVKNLKKFFENTTKY